MELRKVVTAGFAMFAMLFGSGNVVYPLLLGRDVGHQLWFGLAGFVLTAVLVPLIGLYSTMLSEGDYKHFLAPLGKIPAFGVTLISLLLIGPFAIAPRCIALSYAAIKMYVPTTFTLVWFSLASAVVIFICTVKDSVVVDLLGKYLGPLKLTLLLGVVAKGLFAPALFVQVGMTQSQAFTKGLLDGYGTLDLLATIFLAMFILSGIRKGMTAQEQANPHFIIKWGLYAGIIGGLLLGIVYAGFCMVSGFYGQQLAGVERAEIFSTLAVLILGDQGGLLANITVAISCLTTAIALTVLFATYLQKDLLQGRIDYMTSLLITIAISTCVSNLGFAGIMSVVGPIVELIYPALCALAVVNILNKLWGFKYIKIPVVLVFLITVVTTYAPF